MSPERTTPADQPSAEAPYRGVTTMPRGGETSRGFPGGAAARGGGQTPGEDTEGSGAQNGGGAGEGGSGGKEPRARRTQAEAEDTGAGRGND